MGMEFNLVNVIQSFSYVSPMLLSFFLVASSTFNKNAKGIVYLGGVLMFSFLSTLLKPLIGSKMKPDASVTCNVFDLGYTNYNSPAFYSVFIAFTLAYLLMPMITNGTYNFYVLISLIILFFIDAFSKNYNKCTTPLGIFLGGLIGVLFGIIYWALLYFTNAENLLFFQPETSDNVVCSRPSKQTFKCKVYKNGKLVKTTTTK